MTTSADRAPPQQLQAAPPVEAVGATATPKSTPTPRWLPGLLTAFMAIALAVRGPPQGLDKNAYFLALSAAFFAGVAGVMAAVVCVSDDPRGHRAAAGVVYYSSVAALAVVAGLSVASLLW